MAVISCCVTRISEIRDEIPSVLIIIIRFHYIIYLSSLQEVEERLLHVAVRSNVPAPAPKGSERLLDDQLLRTPLIVGVATCIRQ